MAINKTGCCDTDSEIEATASPTQTSGCVETAPCATTTTCVTPKKTSCVTTQRSCTPCPDTTVKPTPYYQAVNMCAENNIKYVRVEKLVGAFTNYSGFCMPACGASVRVVFHNVGDMPIGAVLWSQGLGYLTITGFNPITSEIELRNDCPDTVCAGQIQAAPGTPVPPCTVFVLTAPSCNEGAVGSSLTFPYLNSGFTAPAPGDCLTITLTNVNGISVNKNITINGGTYRVSAVNSGSQIEICNDGAGLIPGTVVDYKDIAGNLIVPIVLLDSNPCSNTAQSSGKPLVCKNNVIVPIEGSENSQVLVWDSTTEEANFRTLGLPVLDCTELTACLTLDPALPSGTAYIVQVADGSAFTATDVVTIGATQFTVDEVVNATTMRIIPVADPTAIQTYNAGAILCTGDCCTTLNVTTDDLVERVTDLETNQADCGQRIDAHSNYNDADPIVPVDIDTLSDTTDGNYATLTVTNDSCEFPMGVHFVINWVWIYDIHGTVGQFNDVGRFAEYAVDVNPLAVTAVVYDLPVTHVISDLGTGYNRHSMAATFSGAFAIAASSSMTIRAKGTMSFNTGDADHVNVKQLDTRISYMAVALLN